MRKPSHLGRTLRNAGLGGTVVRVESRELNEEEKAQIAEAQRKQAERLARIAARAKGEQA